MDLKELAMLSYQRDAMRDSLGTGLNISVPRHSAARDRRSPPQERADGLFVSPADEAAAEFNERAAIIAEGAKVPAAWAEAFATLDCSRPVHPYTAHEWQRLIDDGARFLDRWGAEAAKLGWRTVDVFGVVRSLGHDMRPRDEVGQRAGLVPLIAGGVVTHITEDRATIVMPSGSSLTYLRRSVIDAVAIWEVAESRGRAA